MVTTLALAILVSCKPYTPPTNPVPPPVTSACEGADRVQRNHDGLEVSRQPNACTTVRCEGADRVRRTWEGLQVSRTSNACTIARCVGTDWVVTTHDGVPLSRLAMRCAPPMPQRPPEPQSDVLRYGLSYR
jgi:hypothetical protein